ncbi:MAG: prepilin-type N-terminal cleavage/methylation domain-containing protein [Sulfurimicrobium sp.]|nr:prepilin-type N-terminal cleavage/methylation domain-containing protein [Sulfurimicrobium sp.]MDZ7656665.1 prepilin-type N-terminal cleavage/methylation domain-containing protein [Sulfurimicrobium sp.]
MKSQQQGFTLIEIAIVLVIIGLLLGGVLKGQELINNARVRNIINQQDGIKAAYFGFQDRYRGLPGDYPKTLAKQNIPGAAEIGCDPADATCQNGKIDTLAESIFAWYHLSKSGFITGSYDGVGTTPNVGNNPTNPFGGYTQLIFDDKYSDAATPIAVFNIKTGANIPASILAEIDRKIDDGISDRGTYRSSDTWGTPDTTCTTGTAGSKTWNANADVKNCGGVNIL